MSNEEKEKKIDTTQFEPFYDEWEEALQFIKYMYELLNIEAKFSDFVTLFIHLTGG